MQYGEGAKTRCVLLRGALLGDANLCFRQKKRIKNSIKDSKLEKTMLRNQKSKKQTSAIVFNEKREFGGECSVVVKDKGKKTKINQKNI